MRIRPLRPIGRVAAAGALPIMRRTREHHFAARQPATRDLSAAPTESAAEMSYTDGFEITSERIGTIVWTITTGELDIATAPQLREHTDRHLADRDAEIIVLELCSVPFIDSSGLHVLIDAAQQPGRVRIMPSAACRRLFDIVGVADRLPLIANHDETP